MCKIKDFFVRPNKMINPLLILHFQYLYIRPPLWKLIDFSCWNWCCRGLMLLNFRSVVKILHWLRTFAHNSPCFSLLGHGLIIFKPFEHVLYVFRSEIIPSPAHSSRCFSLPDLVSGDRLIEAASHCSLDKKVSLNSKSIRRTLPRYMTRSSWVTWNVFVQNVECICQYLSAVLCIYCIWLVCDESQLNTHFRKFVCTKNEILFVCLDLLLKITKRNLSNC